MEIQYHFQKIFPKINKTQGHTRIRFKDVQMNPFSRIIVITFNDNHFTRISQ